VPNTQIICYDYPEVPILYEVHNLPASKECLTPEKWNTQPDFKGVKVGVAIQCEGGYTVGTTAFDNAGKKLNSFPETEDHFANFIKALRSGKREDLNADILEGHISTSICHAGNISYRLGKPASVAEMQAAVKDTPLMSAMLDRYLAHLKAHDVAPGTSILGPWLQCDPERERFKDNDAANELVRGFYRKPFVAPEA
jgi:hypothetical protein